jgi:hypothetical protein
MTRSITHIILIVSTAHILPRLYTRKRIEKKGYFAVVTAHYIMSPLVTAPYIYIYNQNALI